MSMTDTATSPRVIARSYFELPLEERLAAAHAQGLPTRDQVLRFIACASPEDQDLIRRVDMRRHSELKGSRQGV